MIWLDGAMEVMPCIIIISFVIFMLTRLFRRKPKENLMDQVPGPPPFPIIENALQILTDSKVLFSFVLANSYIWSRRGPIYRVRYGHVDRINIVKADAVEAVLSSSTHLDKSPDYDFLHPWLGTGLLTSTGTKWHSRRKLLTPAFHFKILEDFLEVFNNQSNKLVHKLQHQADGKPFDVFPYITLCTLDIICETAMGQSINAQDNNDSEYVRAVNRMTTLLLERMARPWEHSEFLFNLLGSAKKHKACLKTLHDFSNSAIRMKRHIKEREREEPDAAADEVIGKKKRLALLDLLLESSSEGVKLSDEDIREEVDTFMFEGHDTTTAAINWVLYLIGCYPEIQVRVQEELDGIFGGTDRPATMADLRQMKYLENCIKEALRLYPSVPFLSRQLKEETVIGGYRIPAGTPVMIIIYRLHRDPDQFPSPEAYDPDRFLLENTMKRHPYAYIPFSAGPRNCIGERTYTLNFF
nr:cytochrome P450 4C1-like [Cherax quadricarinatus]